MMPKLIDLDSERNSPHWYTCVHPMDQSHMILVKDAEQIAVLYDFSKDVFHYSLHVGQWFSCSQVHAKQVDQWTRAEEMSYIEDKAKFLRMLQE